MSLLLLAAGFVYFILAFNTDAMLLLAFALLAMPSPAGVDRAGCRY